MTLTQFVQSQLQAPVRGIETTLKLLSEDCTFPFTARYRKDETGNLDEVQMKEIFKLHKQFEEIQKRKESILKSIEERGQISSELQQKTEHSFDLQGIEDWYLPYKKKRKTKAEGFIRRNIKFFYRSQIINKKNCLASKTS